MYTIKNYLNKYKGDNIAIYQNDVEDDIYMQDISYDCNKGQIKIMGYNEIDNRQEEYIIREKDVKKVINNVININIIYDNQSDVILENW